MLTTLHQQPCGTEIVGEFKVFEFLLITVSQIKLCALTGLDGM